MDSKEFNEGSCGKTELNAESETQTKMHQSISSLTLYLECEP